MESFAAWFKAKRISAGFPTQPDLFLATGVSVRTLSKIESGEYVKLNRTNSNMLAETLGVPRDEFRKMMLESAAQMKKPAAKQAESTAGISPTVYLSPPEWTADIRAGDWIEIPLCGDDSDPKIDALNKLQRFRLHIVGDCMEPLFRDGDRVEFRLIVYGETQMQPGKAYAVCKTNGEATFKLFDHDDDDGTLYFRPANPKYAGKILPVPYQEIGRLAIAESKVLPLDEAREDDDAKIAALARETAVLRGIDPLEMLETMKDVASKDHRNRPAPRRQRRQTNARR